MSSWHGYGCLFMSDIDFSSIRVNEPEPSFFSAQIAEARRFCLDLNPPRSTRLAVACGGREHCSPDYRVERDSFQFYSVELVAAGHGTLMLDGVTHALGPGDVFVYGPRVRHCIMSSPRPRLVKYFVDFSGKMALQVLRACGLVPGTIVQTSAPDTLVRLMDEMIATARQHGPCGPQICALLLEQMLLRLFETSVPASSLETKAFATFQTCRQYIADHHLQIDGLAAVSRACGVDVSYLCRLFRRFDRQGPYQYLTRLKMATAADMLQGPGVLVKQVAAELGFSDQFHFSRAFR